MLMVVVRLLFMLTSGFCFLQPFCSLGLASARRCFCLYHRSAVGNHAQQTCRPLDSASRREKEKTAQLYAAAIMKYSLVTDPVTVDPDEIGPDRLNRSGSTPNLQVMCLASNDRRFKIYLAVKLCSSHMRQHSEDPRIVDCPHRFIYVCYGVFWQGLGVLFCGFAYGSDLA